MTGHKPWCKYGLTLLSDPPKDIPCDCETQHYKRDNDYWIPEMRKEQRRVSDRVNADARAMAERVSTEVERQYQAAVAERDHLRAELATAKEQHKQELDAMAEGARLGCERLKKAHAAEIKDAEERALKWADCHYVTCFGDIEKLDTKQRHLTKYWNKYFAAYRASQQQPSHKPWCQSVQPSESMSRYCTCERRDHQRRDGKDRRAWTYDAVSEVFGHQLRDPEDRRKADRRQG